MFEMIKLDDGTYVPRTWCTVTNPTTSGGESNVDELICFAVGTIVTESVTVVLFRRFLMSTLL